MAVAGDILEQPETGWTRYTVSGLAIDDYPQISSSSEGSIRQVRKWETL